MSRFKRVAAVVDRELRTLVRTRSLLGVAGAFTLIVLGIAGGAMGAPGGYISLTLDLLTVLEVTIPALAFGFVYRSIRGDAERSELDIIRTYPVTRVEYVVGVYLGRAAGMLVVIGVALGIAGVIASLGSPSAASFLATHSAGDSPIVFVRFVSLALLYALAVAAMITAASAAARTTREALAVGVGLVLVVAVGLDLAIIGLLSAGTLGGGLEVVLGVSIASAFRGLVIELAVAPALASAPPIPAASPVVSILGLAAWTALSLAIATVAVWR